MNTDHDLEKPDDSILDYINSQAPNDEQMEQALQTYHIQPLIDPLMHISPVMLMKLYSINIKIL